MVMFKERILGRLKILTNIFLCGLEDLHQNSTKRFWQEADGGSRYESFKLYFHPPRLASIGSF